MTAWLRSWIDRLFRRSQLERDMREELLFHIQARTDDLSRPDTSRAETERRARVEFGRIEMWKERCRETWGTGAIHEMSRNLRDAWRSARRSPGFVAVALLSLGLGIGANIALFSLLHAMLLSPLPVRDPGGLHQVVLSTVRQPYYGISYPKFKTLGEQFPLFESLFGWGSQGSVDILTGDRRDTGRLTLVTGTYFEGLGVRPALGRLVASHDDQPGGRANVAVISHRLWRRLFDADPGVLTRSITISEVTLKVIGVTPSGFAGAEPADPADVYVPVHAMQPARPALITANGMMWMHVMARLKPEVPTEHAAVALREGWSRIDRQTSPNRGDNTRPEFLVLEDGSHGFSSVRIEFSRPIVVLMALVAIVFLITCANLSSLLFVRATRRADEMSVRTALGARRSQLVRQWLTECLLLAFVGGVAGLLTARWMTDLLLHFVPETNRDVLRFQATPEVLAFSLGLTLAAGLLFGWLPALRASGVNLPEALRGHGPSIGARRGRLARIVLAAQIAASLVLVVGAVLFARTLSNLNETPAGFDRKTVVYGSAAFFRAQYSRDQSRSAMEEILGTLRRSPHFTSVAVGSPPLVYGGAGSWSWAKVPGYELAPDENNLIAFYYCSAGFFRTLSIPFVAGRDFEERDIPAPPARPSVAIVSEKFARHYFADRNPLGQRFSWGPAPPVEIIGVVRDVNDASLRTPPNELVYVPQAGNAPGMILARPAAGLDPEAAQAELRSTISAIAKDVPVESGRMETAVQESLSRDRLVTELSAAFGVLGLLLASIGLFGAVAHWVSGRTREIGIRMALGATHWDIARMVFRQSLSVTGAGILVGVPLAVVGAKLIEPLLFGVSSTDVVALAVSALLLAATGTLAACWPARRAAGLNPLEALRDR